jgi:Gly-Xaa carboxypeptidase
MKLISIRHKKLGIETINEHAFLYTWEGSDSSLKPLVFMAHSDVWSFPLIYY